VRKKERSSCQGEYQQAKGYHDTRPDVCQNCTCYHISSY
jgi:hypothetical protein